MLARLPSSSICDLTWRTGRDSPDRVRLDYIHWLHVQGSFTEMWTIEGACNQWTAEGRFTAAGTILGFLEANHVGHALHASSRDHTARTIRADPDGEAAMVRGASLSRDELVDFVLAELGTSAAELR